MFPIAHFGHPDLITYNLKAKYLVLSLFRHQNKNLEEPPLFIYNFYISINNLTSLKTNNFYFANFNKTINYPSSLLIQLNP